MPRPKNGAVLNFLLQTLVHCFLTLLQSSIQGMAKEMCSLEIDSLPECHIMASTPVVKGVLAFS